MRAPIDPGDREFLDRLHRLGPGTIQEICAHLGVTATAVRQRLSRLQSLDFVTREPALGDTPGMDDVSGRSSDRANGRPSVRRGRPSHRYHVTIAGRRELGDNSSDLARILWTEIGRIEDPVIRAKVLASVQKALIEHYGAGVRGHSLAERFRGLCDSLTERGFDVEIAVRDSLPILRENNCPYLDLAMSDPSICELEQEVFRQILGTSVELTQCCLSGASCCEFRPTGVESLAAKPAAPTLVAVT